MRKLALFLFITLFAGLQTTMAQTKAISGKVVDDLGEALPGVAVVVKGTTVGTTSRFDGTYSFEVPSDATTLVFTFVGMTTQEVAIAGQSTINVTLTSDTEDLDEVVVTALGISREKKSLGYAVQEVSGDEMNKVQSSNFATALSGKVAGVQISNGTNMGGSSNVIIRGSSSLTNNNQALFVVDGVPIDNSINNSSYQAVGGAGYDYGNAASDINQNDIESVSVLKGAAATALYGSRAANGVILITTKKGKEGKKDLGVSVNYNVTLSKIDKKTMPEYQTEYGAGYGDYYYSDTEYGGFEYYADVDGDGSTDYTVPYYEDASRGEKFDENKLVYQWDAYDVESPNYMTATPYVMTDNTPDTFFETGVSHSTNVSIDGGSETTAFRVSYTNMDQTGIMPNSTLKKNNFVLNGSHELSDKLKASAQLTFANTQGKGRASTGYSTNIMSSFRQWYQVNVDLAMQEQLYKQTGRNITWNRAAYDDESPAYWDNPYWARYENYQTDERNRIIGYAQLDYEFNKNLSVMGRYSLDTYNTLQEERKAVGSIAGAFGVNYPDASSGYARKTYYVMERNIDLLIKYNASITDNLSFNGLLGTNIRRKTYEYLFQSTSGGLAVAGIYALSNSVDSMEPPVETYYKQGNNGFFGSVSFGYKNMLFLDATGRVDQSSTLPSDNNTYFYPSVTGSFIFSNVVKANWLSFGKVRLNYAQVGNDAPALNTKDTYTANAPFSGVSLITVPDTKANGKLKAENQVAYEAGLEMKFLRNRVGFDLAVYKNTTFDQLMSVSTSYATGYSAKWVNAGEIENKGVELYVTGTPIKTSDFSWDIAVNWAKNQNKVVELYKDEYGNEVKNLQLGSLQGGITINAKVGEAYGAILGSDYVYEETTGKPIVSSTTGRYQVSDTNDNVIGNATPDWTGGVNNSFRYKNVSLSFLIDIQHGGDIFSLDHWYGAATGLYKESAGLNDLGNAKRDPIVQNEDGTYASNSGGTINPGVYEDGTTNTTRVSNQNYGAAGYAVDPNKRYVYDASYVKLRELSLTYSLPGSLLDKTFLSAASLSFVGSNLWIIHKNLPYSDPEASQSAGNIRGWQSGTLPATKNFGFNVNLKF